MSVPHTPMYSQDSKEAGVKYVELQTDEIVDVKFGELYPRTQYTVLTINVIP